MKMSLEKAILTKQICKKLRNLKDYLPNEEDRVYHFAVDLAMDLTRFYRKKYLTAEEFTSEAESTIVNSYIDNRHYMIHPGVYGILRDYIPKLASLFCPEDFAERVKGIYEQETKKILKGLRI